MSERLSEFPIVERDGVSFHVDRHGFPVEDCGRCGGSGMFGPLSVYGGRCFDCNGGGIAISGKVAAVQYGLYRAEVRKAQSRSGHSIIVGDRLRVWGDKTAPFREVVAVEATDRSCGSSLIGTDEANRVHYFYQRVTFDDGEVRDCGSEAWVRKSPVDASEYVERAQAATVRRLKRRKRAA